MAAAAAAAVTASPGVDDVAAEEAEEVMEKDGSRDILRSAVLYSGGTRVCVRKADHGSQGALRGGVKSQHARKKRDGKAVCLADKQRLNLAKAHDAS